MADSGPKIPHASGKGETLGPSRLDDPSPLLKAPGPVQNEAARSPLVSFAPWSPGSAWLCGAVVSLIGNMAGPALTWIVTRSSAGFALFASSHGSFLCMILVALVLLWSAVILSGVQTFQEFWREFSFSRKAPHYYLWGC